MQDSSWEKNNCSAPVLGGGSRNCLKTSNIQGQAGIEILSSPEETPKHWYVMRDLKRPNAKLPAYKFLESLGVSFFTPMHWRLIVRDGKRISEYVPFIADLLFVYETREKLDAIVAKTPTLQYRYQKGKPYCDPMMVPDDEMNRFMHAVGSVGNPQYYQLSEITPAMWNRNIRIVGGHLDGYEGKLLKVRGSRSKQHILVELLILRSVLRSHLYFICTIIAVIHRLDSICAVTIG